MTEQGAPQSELLFKLEATLTLTIPKAQANLDKAIQAATKILRSDTYITAFCNLYRVVSKGKASEEPRPHVHPAQVRAILNKKYPEPLFLVDINRRLEGINARVSSLPSYDPWKVYLNPLLLTEMVLREYDHEHLSEARSRGEDLLSSIDKGSVWDSEGNPRHRHHNSLVYAEQWNAKVVEEHEASPRKRARTDDSAAKETMEEVDVVDAVADVPTTYVPSDMAMKIKHILVLTVLLVHEATNLLMHAVNSPVLKKDPKSNAYVSPTLKVGEQKDEEIANSGHLLEYRMFGYVIHHLFDDAMPAPFAIHEVIGCAGEFSSKGVILTAKPELVALLDGQDVPVDADMLRLTPTSDVLVGQNCTASVTLGRSDEPYESSDVAAPSDPMVWSIRKSLPAVV